MSVRMNRFALVAVTSAVCFAAAVCYARVFFRWGSSGAGTAELLETVGGRPAYKAAVNVNGGYGMLTVLAFDKTIAGVIADLRRIPGVADFSYAGGAMARATINSNGRVARLTIIRLDSDTQTLAFMFEQSDSDLKASAGTPNRHLMKGIPAYPGSEPVFFAENENTRMSLAVSMATAAPGDIHAFFDSYLTGAGWTPLFSPTRNNVFSDSVMRMYRKRHDIACVFAESLEGRTSARITLLHKQHEIE